MRPLRRILVAIKDVRAKSQPSLAKAIQVARGSGAALEIFHAISQPLYFSVFGSTATLREIQRDVRADVLSQLERLAAQARRHGVDPTVCAEWDFPAHEAIVRRARHIGADLVVAARHAGHRVLPGLMQLADWELLRWSPVPVLLVQEPKAYRRPVVLAAIDPGHSFAKPGRLDHQILGAAEAAASALSGSLHVVHAYVPVSQQEASRGFRDSEEVRKVMQATRSAAQALLGSALRKFEVPESRRHLIPRHPVDAIQDAARDSHSTIVVMGAVSRSGLKRFLIGNTAESLLDKLHCDVLIVKPQHFTSRVPRRRRGPDLIPATTLAGA